MFSFKSPETLFTSSLDFTGHISITIWGRDIKYFSTLTFLIHLKSHTLFENRDQKKFINNIHILQPNITHFINDKTMNVLHLKWTIP